MKPDQPGYTDPARRKMAWVVPEGKARNPYLDYPRNMQCFCGSGKKFKKCCQARMKDVVDAKDVNNLTNSMRTRIVAREAEFLAKVEREIRWKAREEAYKIAREVSKRRLERRWREPIAAKNTSAGEGHAVEEGKQPGSGQREHQDGARSGQA